GFALRPIAWWRRGDGLLGAIRAIMAIAGLYRAERPDIVHHVALKPVLFGGLARRLAFPHAADAPASVDSVMGLGSSFSGMTTAARLRRRPLGMALRLAAGSGRGWVVAQNPEDRAALAGFGIDPKQIALIRGSGVDITRFVPLPDPDGGTMTVALVSRMLRDKALLEAAACGRPLVAADVPGCREAVHPGETGLLVPPHDVDAIADAIAALAADPARRAAMGRAGRALIECHFTDEIVARDTLALYRTALVERSGFPVSREKPGKKSVSGAKSTE